MKILQTLGRHGGTQEGIFQYRRTAHGIYIDGTVGQSQSVTQPVSLSSDEWQTVLEQIRDADKETFRITGTGPFNEPPNLSLYELIGEAVKHPTGGWNWNDSLKAYVCSILEHEGSIDLYHGTLGQNHSARICLKKDVD